MDATGLTRQELAGAELTVTANVTARTDADVDPHGWQLLNPTDQQSATRRSALYAARARCPTAPRRPPRHELADQLLTVGP
jgi:hypothetical protein